MRLIRLGSSEERTNLGGLKFPWALLQSVLQISVQREACKKNEPRISIGAEEHE